jgi:hypothetical protein
MADVKDCIDKLAVAGKISRKVADEALDFYKRSQAKYAQELGPASADAAAALETAKKMRDTAKQNQIAIAADVKTFQINERRVMEDPRGRNAAVAGMLTKDTIIGDNRLKALKKSEPDHPIFSGGNADYKYQVVRDSLYNMLGPAMEKFRPGFLASKELVQSTKNFVYERFGVRTGDAAAKAVSDGFGQAIKYGADRATAAGKVFDQNEDWRLMQPWTSSQVMRFPEAEFVRDFRAAVDTGALKLRNKETGGYAQAAHIEPTLKRAYSDIKTEGAQSSPFSKQMRTFEFQPGQAGADAWLKLQGKYGVGNEIMSAVDQHLDRMARDIGLHEQFGAHPDAQFAALMRLVKDDPSKTVKGMGFTTSENTLQHTYDTISGRGNPIANEAFARIMSGARDLVGVASLRNLPLTIIPGDAAMTAMATNFNGMSVFNVLKHVFNGTMTKDVARHLQIAAHSNMDYINNTVRKYEDQINVSGLVRKVSRTIVKATGADLWSTNGRLGFQISYLNQLDGMRGQKFADLNPATRDNFLANIGITEADWDKIRASQPFVASNGASYIDPTKIDKPLADRLLMGIKEQGSYAFHQPDARTEAIMHGGAVRGTLFGEARLSMGQYKQFTMERMTTHLMRTLVDGPVENRVARGLAFTLLSMAAGAVSIQAAAVIGGKDPIDMASPKFWLEAFARGGAGGIYGDILTAGLHGDRGGVNLAAQMAGPIPGLAGDIANAAFSPLRHKLDDNGRPSKATFANEVFGSLKRHSPSTWYTKLATDRLLWDKMQVLIDPDYRGSFRRAEQSAKKSGTGFWFGPGDTTPARAPNIGNAFGQ